MDNSGKKYYLIRFWVKIIRIAVWDAIFNSQRVWFSIRVVWLSIRMDQKGIRIVCMGIRIILIRINWLWSRIGLLCIRIVCVRKALLWIRIIWLWNHTEWFYFRIAWLNVFLDEILSIRKEKLLPSLQNRRSGWRRILKNISSGCCLNSHRMRGQRSVVQYRNSKYIGCRRWQKLTKHQRRWRMKIISVIISSLGLEIMRNFRIGYDRQIQTGWERVFRNPIRDTWRRGDCIRRAAPKKWWRRNGEVELRKEIRISGPQTEVFVALLNLIVG